MPDKMPRILVPFGNVPLHGQERANIELMDVLQQQGCEVLFLIRSDWTKDTIQRELDGRGLRWVAVPWFDAVRRGHGPRVWWNNVTGILGGSIEFLRWKRRFGATHVHCCSLSNALNFLPALLLTRIPLVFRAGDVPLEHHWLWKFVFRFLRWRTHTFIAISRFIAGELEHRGVESERIRQIYSIPPSREIRDTPSQYSRGRQGVTFVYVGQLIEEKGIALLVEAAERLLSDDEDLTLLMAGDYSWNNKFACDLRERVERRGLSDHIRFLGYVNDIPSLLEQSDVNVCPSLCQEALGNVVLEAKLAGIPSIVFPSGGLPELIEEGEDGYVCSDKSVGSLMQRMDAYLSDPEIIATHGLRASESLSRFCREKFTSDWLNVYSS